MKILHTSDWHLGRSLYGRKRYEEFSKFLDWLYETIVSESVDALLIAGDVFDTCTPSNRAQELYYGFLCKVAASTCRNIIIIAGNHDSPTFLNAPKEVLRTLNVYVVGAKTDNPKDEVIALHDAQQNLQALVCAVPYLRDKDIRTVEPGESFSDKNKKLEDGLKKHYAEVVAIAEQSRAERNQETRVPIIAMGHLFTAGGKTLDGDGVRELYVGSLAQVKASLFPPSIDYFALGHLHVPQSVDSSEHIRYCGSPIPMGFGEAKQQKTVVIVEFNPQKITPVPVPCFQKLERILGSLDVIHSRIEQLIQDDSNAWLEIEVTGSEVYDNLQESLEEALDGTSMEILRIKNQRVMDRVFSTMVESETLDDLDENDVFQRLLDAKDILPESRGDLLRSYREIIQSLHEEDVNEL